MEIRLTPRGYAAEIQWREAADRNGSGYCSPADRASLELAVLPFANLSEDPQLDSFCQGLTLEIIALLTELPNISVVARTSSFRYEGEAVDVREAGREFGVGNLLEGSVRAGESAMRVTATLVSCSNGFTAWSKIFEVPLGGDPVERQATVGGLIADALSNFAGELPTTSTQS